MTIVTATCGKCGDVKLTPGEVHCHYHDVRHPDNCFRFLCPRCGESVRRPLSERQLQLLMGAGSPIHYHDAPVAGPSPNPPITWDDVLDFKLEVQRRGDAFSAWEAA